MYAYSRIKKVSLKRSKSLDLKNLPRHTPTLSSANYYNHSKPKDHDMKPNNITRSSTTTRLDPSRMLEQDNDQVGEVFGVILGRKYHPADAVKRSFSMRRSTSINGEAGYRRMNRCCCCSHQYLSSTAAAHEDDLYHKNHVQKRSGKLLFKVCRSLFGFM